MNRLVLALPNPSQTPKNMETETPDTDNQRAWSIRDPYADDVKSAVDIEFARKMERERNHFRHALCLISDTSDNPEGWASDAQIARHYLGAND